MNFILWFLLTSDGWLRKSTYFLEKFIFLFQTPDFFILILNAFAEHRKLLSKTDHTFWSICTIANIQCACSNSFQPCMESSLRDT